MKLQKKHLVASLIGLLSVTSALLYLEVKKLMDYAISVSAIKLKKIDAKQISIDLFLKFINKSIFKLTILSQKYVVSINDKDATTISNVIPQVIKPKTTSLLAANIQFDPQKVLDIVNKNISDILLKPETVNVKISMEIRVGIGLVKFNINYDYLTNFKELTTSSVPNKNQKNN